MVDWSSPAEQANEAAAFDKVIFCLFGLYVWEIWLTSWFEWSLITGKRKFTWPMVFFFFVCRYSMLWALIGLLISMSSGLHLNCGALYTFNSVTGNLAILCASTSLMIRTIALWDRRREIIIVLGVFCLAHWALLWRGMFIVDASFDPTVGACVVTKTNHVFLNVTFFSTMAFDLAILLFTIVALVRKHKTHTDLWKFLLQDGVAYFAITFCCNSIPAVLNVINLNPVMDIVGTIPAATFSTIAACRAVIRLQEFTHSDVYVHSSQVVSENSRGMPMRTQVAKPKRYNVVRPEVHVTTDIVMDEFGHDSSSVNTPHKHDEAELDYDKESDVSQHVNFSVHTAV